MESAVSRQREILSKVPAVTLTFWIIKILATTLGETGGDSVTMTWLGETTPEANPFGYLIGTGIFAVALAALVWLQIWARRFNPWIYWATIVASTTAGTTLADLADRSLGIGYTGGSSLLFAAVMVSLGVWYLSERTISVDTVSTPRVEVFYWVTITFSQTLGTALGDWVADTGGFGFGGGVMLFAGALAVVAALNYWTRISKVALFWAAFILTRPLGATAGDLLDKPLADGGLNLSRPLASLAIAVIMIACVAIFPQKAGRHPSAA
ncbi:MAG TPA: hypothetical protein VGF71_12910 [Caulobacteraceae bacterium]|jgi:uncharacterized membrane-anchored protein